MIDLVEFLRKKNVSSKKVLALKNIMWAVAGKCISLLGVLVTGIIVARYLGKENYGLINYTISVVTIFQVFADFGLDFIQIREESRNIDDKDRILGTTFILKLIFALISVFAIVIVVSLSETDTTKAVYILIYAVTIILNTTWVSRNHFTAIVWNEYIVKTEITRTIIGIAVKVGMVLLHLPCLYFIIALVFDSVLLATGYTVSYLKKIGNISRWTFDRKLACYMTRQSFPLMLSGAAIIIYNRIDQLMISNMIDNGHLGIYSVAVRFVEIMTFVPTILSQTVSPFLVAIRKEDEEKYNAVSANYMNLTVWGCVVLALIVSFSAFPLVYFTFGEAYISAVAVLSILAFKVVADALSQTSGQLIIVEEIQKYAPIRNIIGCGVCIALNYILIGQYGIKGAAVVAIVSIATSGFLSNGIIPAYRHLFRMQCRTLLLGWKSIKINFLK